MPGFANAARLADHFKKHKARLGLRTQEEYLNRANAFMDGALPPDVLEGIRASDNCRLRFNPTTQEFGVAWVDTAVIRTYHVRKSRKDAAWFAQKCAE